MRRECSNVYGVMSVLKTIPITDSCDDLGLEERVYNGWNVNGRVCKMWTVL